MPIPFIPLGATSKVAPFKSPHSKPYGPFSNNTEAWDYPIKQNIMIHKEALNFDWPSAEHAFHAQKIIHLKKKLPENDALQQALTKVLREIETSKNKPKEVFLSRQDYDPIIDRLISHFPVLGPSKVAFEALCDAHYINSASDKQELMSNGKPYSYKFMRDVIKMKFDQHPKLKALAIDCAREGILPIEINHLDNIWSSGDSGKGENKLGVIMLTLGNQYLKAMGERPIIKNPETAYLLLQRENQNAISYGNLLPFTETTAQGWTMPKASLLTAPYKEQPSQYIQRKLAHQGCILARTAPDLDKPNQMVLQLRFSSIEECIAFKNKHCGGATPASADGKTIILGSLRTPVVLRNLGIDSHGYTYPKPIMLALREEYQRLQGAKPMRLFKTFKGPSALDGLIQLLQTIPRGDESIFNKSLIDFLKQLREQVDGDPTLNDSRVLMSKIKDFSERFSPQLSENHHMTLQIIHLIKNPEIQKLSDFRENIVMSINRDKGLQI